MALTEHNRADKENLDEIARGHRVVRELLPFCENMVKLCSERHRRFLSAWGAVGQAGGRWGIDIGNVTYATAWHHLLDEADTARWEMCRTLTARVASGNVIEALFGVMYLTERSFQSMKQFTEEAEDRGMHCLSRCV